jgi:hypothetical protein
MTPGIAVLLRLILDSQVPSNWRGVDPKPSLLVTAYRIGVQHYDTNTMIGISHLP